MLSIILSIISAFTPNLTSKPPVAPPIAQVQPVEKKSVVEKIKTSVIAIKKGMSKKQVAENLGKPSDFLTNPINETFFYNRSTICQYDNHGCIIIFVKNKVVNYNNIKPDLIADIYD